MRKSSDLYKPLSKFALMLPYKYTKDCENMQQSRWLNWFRSPIANPEHLEYAKFICNVAKSLEPLHQGKTETIFNDQSAAIILDALIYIQQQLSKTNNNQSILGNYINTELQKYQHVHSDYSNLIKHLRFHEKINDNQPNKIIFLSAMNNHDLIIKIERESFELVDSARSLTY